MEFCEEAQPPLRPYVGDHETACRRAEELEEL
jgi:hypothetical protein